MLERIVGKSAKILNYEFGGGGLEYEYKTRIKKCDSCGTHLSGGETKTRKYHGNLFQTKEYTVYQGDIEEAYTRVVEDIKKLKANAFHINFDDWGRRDTRHYSEEAYLATGRGDWGYSRRDGLLIVDFYERNKKK